VSPSQLDGRRRVLDDAPAIELNEELAEAVREHGYLGLLEPDADDPPAVAGLQEEGTVPGLTDGTRGEAVGEVEDEEAAWHGPDCTREFRAALARRQPTLTSMV